MRNLEARLLISKISELQRKPKDIPKAAHQTYKKDWKGYGDWLGTGTIASFKRKYRT